MKIKCCRALCDPANKASTKSPCPTHVDLSRYRSDRTPHDLFAV